MNFIRFSIDNPVKVTVGVILMVLFGGIAYISTPVQLTPDVVEPEITITTMWPGASAQEVEREIIEAQEEQLKSVEGLEEFTSESSDSMGSITLQFPVGTDLSDARARVAEKLNQVARTTHLDSGGSHLLDRTAVHARNIRIASTRSVLHRDLALPLQHSRQLGLELLPTQVNAFLARQVIQHPRFDPMHQANGLAGGRNEVEPAARETRILRKSRDSTGQHVRTTKVVQQPAVEAESSDR